MYLLEKGFKHFYENHEELCVGTYKCQFGDKRERSRCASMKRSLANYCAQD